MLSLDVLWQHVTNKFAMMLQTTAALLDPLC